MTRTPTPTIEYARRLWSDGYQRKEIARRTGLSERSITGYCVDLPKPIEHRGRKKSARWLGHAHREDFEDEY